MEFVREIVDSSRLSSIITIPDSMKNQRVEVIILPVKENQAFFPHKTKGTVARSLIGSIPGNLSSLEKMREERLSKYEYSD